MYRVKIRHSVCLCPTGLDKLLCDIRIASVFKDTITVKALVRLAKSDYKSAVSGSLSLSSISL